MDSTLIQGYGIRTDKIEEVLQLKNLLKLLTNATKKTNTKVCQYILDILKNADENDPINSSILIDDLADYEDEYSWELGVAVILKDIFNELYDLQTMVFTSEDNDRYIILDMRLPWEYTDHEREMTSEILHTYFEDFLAKICDTLKMDSSKAKVEETFIGFQEFFINE